MIVWVLIYHFNFKDPRPRFAADPPVPVDMIVHDYKSLHDCNADKAAFEPKFPGTFTCHGQFK
jgi:hypothetical protein